MDSLGQTEYSLDFSFEIQMPGGQCGPQSQSTGGQQHVLNRRVDGCSRRTAGRRLSVVLAGHDPDGRFVVMVGQIFHGAVLPTIAAGTGTGRGFAGQVSGADHFIEGALVVSLDLLFDGLILDDQKPPALAIPAAGRVHTRAKYLLDQLIGHRVGLEPAHGTGGSLDLK